MTINPNPAAAARLDDLLADLIDTGLLGRLGNAELRVWLLLVSSIDSDSVSTLSLDLAAQLQRNAAPRIIMRAVRSLQRRGLLVPVDASAIGKARRVRMLAVRKVVLDG